MTVVLFYKFIVYLFGLKSGLDQERAQPDEMPLAATHLADVEKEDAR
ncbi:hypothetical protein NR756_23050 [Alloalcanivorax xenomutans]